MAALYNDNAEEKEQAKLDYLFSYTTGEARKWMSTLLRDMRLSWDCTTAEMKKKFPLSVPIPSKRSAWKTLNELKQNGRPLEEYFQDARDILAQLQEHKHEVADQVIDGLDSLTIQECVGAHVGEGPYVLEEVIHLIRSASREKTSARKDKDDPIEEKLRDAEPSRELLQYLFKQSKNKEKKEAVLAGLVEQFNREMNLNAGQSQGYNSGPPRQPGRPIYPGVGTENRKPGPARVAFNMDNAVCYRCGQTGHIRPKCTNPPLPEADQERLKTSTERRGFRPEAGNGYCPIDNRSRPMGVAQAETWHTLDETDYWTPGDRNMHVH